jgi:hypothetical protein
MPAGWVRARRMRFAARAGGGRGGERTATGSWGRGARAGRRGGRVDPAQWDRARGGRGGAKSAPFVEAVSAGGLSSPSLSL